MNMIQICFLWVIWCAMHSILIDPLVTGSVKRRCPQMLRYYRLFYNGFSLLTLVPLMVMTHLAPGEAVFSWDGYGVIGRGLLLLSAFYFLKGGARYYDLQYFFGIRQLKTGEINTLLGDSEDFSEIGVFGITRHPWYLCSMFLVWSILPNYNATEALVAVILSSYLVVGTLLEERKILAEHGVSYRRYQQRVSMIFPWKWIMRKLNDANS